MGPAPNEIGSSRYHLINACDASLRRLGTDYIDLYQMHGFDALTPVEETLGTLNDLVRAGENPVHRRLEFFRLAPDEVARHFGSLRLVALRCESGVLLARRPRLRMELMPLGVDQGVGAVVWSPLGWGRLTGKIRRGSKLHDDSRLHKTAVRSAGSERARLQSD